MLKKILQLLATPFLMVWYRLKHHSIIKLRTGLNMKTKLEGYNKIGNSNISSSFIGRGTYIGNNCILSNCEIGRFCSLGSNIKVLAATHPTSKFVSTHPSFFSTLKQAGFSFVDNSKFDESLFYDEKKKTVIKIGNDVWIGDDVTIIGGHEIGNGAVLATGAVVTKDVPPYSIVGGVPAVVKRYRFTNETIAKLEKIKWWDNSMEWLCENADIFSDIEKFMPFSVINDEVIES